MPEIRFEGFSGMIPRMSKRLLPPNAATAASNTKLLSGELRGYRVPRQVADLTNEPFTVRRAFRIPEGDYYANDIWLAFSSRNVDVVRSPIINDSYDRYYWAGDGDPKYNSLERIVAGADPLLLGVPTPTAQPDVAAETPGDLTRAYTYTFVSDFGEESAPAPPRVASGAAGDWTISGMQTTVPDAAQRLISKKRIYRTVSGNTSSSYYRVTDVALGVTSYIDTMPDDQLAFNPLMESASWAPPPPDLEGFVVMPNGYLVGWVGRRLVFSEPYRPHAWPAEYELSTEFEIVGMAVWSDTLVIGTRSNPYIGQGVTPSAFTMRKLDVVEPCLSRRGVVPCAAGVYYPSLNGLMMIGSGGPQLVTQDLLTKEEWLSRYSPSTIFAAQYGLQYIAFINDSFGFIFNPVDKLGRFVEIDRYQDVEGIEADRYDGTVYFIYQDRVWEFDPQESERVYWRWRSKEFHFAKPLNFGAAKIKFNDESEDVSLDVEAYYGPYNEVRFNVPVAKPSLSTLNGHALHGIQHAGLVAGWTEPENRMPLGGSPLYPIVFMSLEDSAVRFTAIADGVTVFDGMVYDQDMIRLPAGFKRDVWQFQLISSANVYSVQIAETGKGLEKV